MSHATIKAVRPKCRQTCGKALEDPKRIGRASYVCPDCDKDISIEVVLLAEVEAQCQMVKAGVIEQLGNPE